MYMEANIRGADAMADALLVIDNHPLYGSSDPKLAKVISDNIKWLLERRHRTIFGQNIVITHNVTADKAIISALVAARERANLPSEPSLLIEGQVKELDEDDDLSFMMA